MIKKFIITLISFIGTIVISFYFYFFLLAMLAMSTDSGTNSMSVYVLKDFSFLLFFASFVSIIGMIPHLIAFPLLSIKIKKEWFSKKVYLCLQGVFFILIFILAFSLHGSFSKETYNKRVVEMKKDQGIVTENSHIYILCNKYLHFNNETEIKEHIQYDKITLDKDFDEIVSRIYVITNTDFDEIYRRLKVSKSEIIREDLQREMILKIFNDFEDNKLTVSEFKEELNKVLESKVQEKKYDPKEIQENLKVSIETDLVYLDKHINSKIYKAELGYINWLKENLKACLEDEYNYNSKLVNSEIYKDYISMLSEYSSIEELEKSIQSFSEKYDLNYKNEVTSEILDNLYLGI